MGVSNEPLWGVVRHPDFYYDFTTNDGMKRGKCKNDKSTIRLLGQHLPKVLEAAQIVY